MTSRLSEVLETIHSARPQEARREMLQKCVDVIGAGTGLFMRQQPDDSGVMRYADIVVEGHATFMRTWNGREVVAGSAHDQSDAAMRSRRGNWSLTSPATWHTNRFSTLRRDIAPDLLASLPVMRDVYVPNGIVDQVRMFAVHEGEVLGWFGFWNSGLEGHFNADQVAELNRASKQVVAALVALDAVDRWKSDSGVAVFTADGRLEAATDDLAIALQGDARQAVATCVRALDRGESPPVFAVGRLLIRATRLDGPAGVRYLLTFSSRNPRLAPSALLSPRERDVAELASLSMTVDEVANQLGVSTNTVKTQLRSAYAKLGVANRVELADALRWG